MYVILCMYSNVASPLWYVPKVTTQLLCDDTYHNNCIIVNSYYITWGDERGDDITN